MLTETFINQDSYRGSDRIVHVAAASKLLVAATREIWGSQKKEIDPISHL